MPVERASVPAFRQAAGDGRPTCKNREGGGLY